MTRKTNCNPICIMSGEKFENMVQAYAAVVTDKGINPLDEIRIRMSAALEAGMSESKKTNYRPETIRKIEAAMKAKPAATFNSARELFKWLKSKQ